MTMAWKIVFEKRERAGEKGVYICFTKYETSLQAKKFLESGVRIHKIQKDGKTVFNRAQAVAKFGSRRGAKSRAS
jgi:hypothetical protein